jgi:hypothetical protein
MRRRLLPALFFVALAAEAVGYATIEPSLPPVPSTPPTAALEQAITTLDSPTFLAFAGLTSWLAYSVIAVANTAFAPRLIRYGSYTRSSLAAVRRSIPYIVWGELVTLLAAAIVGILRVSGSSGRGAGAHPLIGVGLIVGQAAILLVAFVTMRVVLEAVSLRVNRRLVLVGIAVILWVWGAASAAGFVSGSPLLDLRSFMSIEVLAEHPSLVPSVAIILAIVWIACIASIRRLDGRHGGAWAWRQSSDFVVGVIMITLAGAVMAAPSGRLADDYESILRGPGASVVQSLTALVVFVGYAFIGQFRVNDQLGGWGALNLIRIGSSGRYLLAAVRREAVRAALYVVLVDAAVAVVYLAGGGTDLSAHGVSLTALLLQLVPVAFLQLLFYVLVIFAGTLATSSALFGPIIIAVIAVVSFIPFDPEGFLPVQRASILDVSSVGSSFHNLIVLATATALALTALFAISRSTRARLGTHF